jgi:hypothetical protein
MYLRIYRAEGIAMEKFIEHYTRYKAHLESLELETKMQVDSF